MATQSVKRHIGEELADAYSRVRKMTEHLTSGLSVEDQMIQPALEASPVKWHQAHTTWFFETFILAEHLPGYREFHADFRRLFNSYYNAVAPPPDRSKRGCLSRPSLEQVRAYREHVDSAMLRLLESDRAATVRELLMLGLNHEQQHQELIVTDTKWGLWVNPLRPKWWSSLSVGSHEASPLEWRSYEGGIVTIGHGGLGFSFDNELPRHEVFLQPFRIAWRLITCGEYLEFIGDGGYRRPELWLSDGWECVRTNGWRYPMYWEERDGKLQMYTCSGMRDVDPSEPVCHVSYYEADAYARWAGMRLATEFEWECASEQSALSIQHSASEGSGEPANFLESERLHPAVAQGSQMFGDCWEWTSSAYAAYPGFRPAAGAVGEYNGKFMCNQFVLRGGSCATPRSHIRTSYRNFFPPQARWQFTGIRLATDGK